MEPIRRIGGKAVPLSLDNVDTDQIVPARFLYRNRRDGFADTLFCDLRRNVDGELTGDFILDDVDRENAPVLVAGANFGCGSSREHAVWALMDFGFRCVIAVSFGDIFRNNALENGLLPVTLPAEQQATILRTLEADPGAVITVDLAEQSIELEGRVPIHFDIEPSAKNNLLNGVGKIDATLARAGEIDAFEAQYISEYPWST